MNKAGNRRQAGRRGGPSARGGRGRGPRWLAWGALTAVGGSVHGELALSLEAGGKRDQLTVSNVFLRVPSGASASPWIPAGGFRAEWTGFLESELRGDHQFRATGSGRWWLELNGATVVEGGGLRDGTAGDWSGPVRLRKGLNPLRVVLEGGTNGDAGLRWEWKGRAIPPGPVPDALLKPPTDGPGTGAEFAAARRGRAAFLELRCGRCHAPSPGPGPVPELNADAPSFEGIGSRRNFGWMARWIEQPKAVRTDATMPGLASGPRSREEARAMAAWLGSLKEKAVEGGNADQAVGNAAVGKALFESLLCGACHQEPGQGGDADRVSLAGVREKFVAGELSKFLLEPGRHYAWTPMPDYRLSAGEAAHLAAWLGEMSPPPDAAKDLVPDDPDGVERGRRLVEERGCLNCHAGPGKNRLEAPAWSVVAGGGWDRGCLGDTEGTRGTRAADYGFDPDLRADLRALGRRDPGAVLRWGPGERAERWMERLRCSGCHGGKELVPGLAFAGEKLRPEWTVRLLRGEVARKSRPWLQARMPAFRAYAEGLGEGMAARHGLPPVSPPEPPVDDVAAADGRKMVSASGGFSCVTCHAVGAFGAAGVFEAPGVNFALTGERLLPEFFARWVRNPQAIEPTTKMPLYFDEEGNSALADFYGGDGPKTIHALWNYLRKGDRIEASAP